MPVNGLQIPGYQLGSDANFAPLAQLPQLFQQGQARATLQNLPRKADGSIDTAPLYNSGDMNLAKLGADLDRQQQTQAQNAQELALRQQTLANTQQYQNKSLAIQERNAANNEDYTPEEQDARRLATLKASGIEPDSQRGKTYRLTGTDPGDDTTKPVPFDTLSGTRFMVRDPNTPGGYKIVDPSALGGQQQPPATPDATKPPDAPKLDTEATDPQTGRREGYLKSLDPQVQDYVRKIADYEIDPRTTSIKGGMREKLLAAVSKYDPTYNQNDFGARAKAIKDFSTGQQGNIVRSFDVAIDHIDTLQKAALAMQNGDSRTLNELRNKWREQTGSDLPTNFKALVPIVSGEIAKAVVGSNNALSDREELRAPLNAASSPEQFIGATNAYKALMASQLKGMRKQYEVTTGKKDFNTRVRKSTLDTLGDGEGGGNSAAKDALKSKYGLD